MGIHERRPRHARVLGLGDAIALAVDGAGNVYIADPGDNALKEWSIATKTLGTLLAAGLNDPSSVALDAAGDVYIANAGDNSILEWNAATKKVSTVVTAGTNCRTQRIGGGPRGQCLLASPL